MVTVETAFIKLGVSWSVALEEDEAGRILVPRSSRQGKKANPRLIEKKRERLRRGRRKKGMEEENKEGRKRKEEIAVL